MLYNPNYLGTQVFSDKHRSTSEMQGLKASANYFPENQSWDTCVHVHAHTQPIALTARWLLSPTGFKHHIH